VSSSIFVWGSLPHLPLHCYNKESLVSIGNTLGKYIDKLDPKGGMFSCVDICIYINLKKGLPEAITLSLDN